MSAFDTPWLDSMSKPSTTSNPNHGSSSLQPSYDPNTATTAAFAPATNSGYSASTKQRSTIIVHKKSPLLVATPPQITRSLAHSHPFILPLNRLAGLLSWSTDDPWESFLLVAAFWAGCLYGGEIVRYATPINVVIFLILGMYSRRYSPLSSTSRTGEKHEAKGHKRIASTSPQHKSLDEIVETLTQFTTRCNILLDPFLTMTDFLSTQRTATSATTRPALTTLFIRIILVTPLWILLTLPPLYILTSRRTILSIGTVILTWHSRPAKISRVILWRSVFIRRFSAFVTGLQFDISPPDTASLLSKEKLTAHQHANAFATTRSRRPNSSGVRFTFILYENQRRWLGLGWTASLFAYERAPWTDEHLNSAPSREEFELPAVDGGHARWRWIDNSSWQVENGDKSTNKSAQAKQKAEQQADGGGWIYYDNKWNDGRAQDGWGRYTRRRKWFRDAELVEATPSAEVSPVRTSKVQSDVDSEAEKIRRAKQFAQSLRSPPKPDLSDSVATIVQDSYSMPAQSTTTTGRDDDHTSTPSSAKRRSGWFTRGHSYTGSAGSAAAAAVSGSERPTKNRDRSVSKGSTSIARSDRSNFSSRSKDDDDVHDQWSDQSRRVKAFGVGEDVVMGLG